MINREIQNAVFKLVQNLSSVLDVQPIGGGCISQAQRVSIVDNDGNTRNLFVKSNDSSFLDNFQAESDGLLLLGHSDVIGVPAPIAVGVVADHAYLITDWTEQQPTTKEFFSDFAQALADLHRTTSGDRIGLNRDNYLGSARQMNTPFNSWPEFFSVHRMEFQLRWAVDQQLASPSLIRDCEAIIGKMDQILSGRDDLSSLLHGDLWSGNYLCGPSGRSFIIDPAVYYGCREAEFGMLRLFGSCPPSFYDAYNDRYPLPAGWQRRTGVYVLYHLLNHLNLFGTGYHGQCQSVAADVLRYK